MQTVNNSLQSEFAKYWEYHFLFWEKNFFSWYNNNIFTFLVPPTEFMFSFHFVILRNNYSIIWEIALQWLVSKSPSLLRDVPLLFSDATSLSLRLLTKSINQEARSIWNLVLSLSCCKKQTGLFITQGIQVFITTDSGVFESIHL